MFLGYKYNWKSVQVDFVQAFPQAPIERKLYMDIPKGYMVEVNEDSINDECKLNMIYTDDNEENKMENHRYTI